MDETSFLDSLQSVFRLVFKTETILLSFVDDLQVQLDKGNHVFRYLSAAFDMVDHSILAD